MTTTPDPPFNPEVPPDSEEEDGAEDEDTDAAEDTEPVERAAGHDAAENTDQAPGLTFGLSDKALSEELHKYAAAIRSEFELSQSKAITDETNVEKYTRDFFKKNLAHAAAQIVWLSSNSTSDSIRLKASMFIVKEAVAGSVAEGDPMAELFKQLRMPVPATTNPLNTD
jgi:hypothetical protein